MWPRLKNHADSRVSEHTRLGIGYPLRHPFKADIRAGSIRVVAFACMILLAGRLPTAAQRVAKVGNAEVTSTDVRQVMVRGGYDVFDPAGVQRAVEEAVNFELLAGEAKRLGLDRDPDVLYQAKVALVQKFRALKVDRMLSDIRPTEQEVAHFFQENPELFSSPTLARVQILSAGNRPRTNDLVKEVRACLDRGESYEAVIQRLSDDAAEKLNATNGVWLTQGQASRRYPTEVVKAAFLQPATNAVMGPLLVGNISYFLRVLEHRQGRPANFELSKGKAIRLSTEAKRHSALKSFCDGLKSTFPVELSISAISNLVDKAGFSSGPPPGPGPER